MIILGMPRTRLMKDKGEIMPVTTKITSFIQDQNIKMGDSFYPMQGSAITINTANTILAECKKQELLKYWNCIEKAKLARSIIGVGTVYVGSLYIYSSDFLSRFGYEFNPPYEFHSWLQIGKDIIDIALPGVIEKGKNTSDEIGPFLIGRSPIILAGRPTSWMEYKSIRKA